MQGHEAWGQAQGHQACRDEHRDTALAEYTGTPGSWGHQAHKNARLKESLPQMLSGFSKPLERQAGGDKPVAQAARVGLGLHPACARRAGAVRAAP